MLQTLLLDGKIARATHNMLAYRVALGPGRVAQDCDDDGESGASARMLHLLEITRSLGVAVVVSRWCALVAEAGGQYGR